MEIVSSMTLIVFLRIVTASVSNVSMDFYPIKVTVSISTPIVWHTIRIESAHRHLLLFLLEVLPFPSNYPTTTSSCRPLRVAPVVTAIAVSYLRYPMRVYLVPPSLPMI